jgi:uncharacterized membrane protein YqjE
VSDEPDCAQAAGNLSRSLERLAATARAYARSQLDRAADSMQAEKKRWLWIMASSLALLLWLSIGAVFAGVAIVVACWETHRVLAAAAVAAGFFVLAGVAAWVLCRKWRQRPTAFEWIAGLLAMVVDYRRPR